MSRALAVSTGLLLASAAVAGPHGPADWARGDLHQHSEYSDDGEWKLEELWARAREVLPVGMRFMVLADHHHIAGFFPNPTRPPTADNWDAWGHARELRRSLGPDELLLSGQELGGFRGGHMGAMCLPQTRGEDPPGLVLERGVHMLEWMQRVRAAGGLNVVFHPRGVQELGPVHPGTFTHWEETAELIDGMSIWNGYKLYDEPDMVAWDWIWAHWQAGRAYTAIAGSDSHVRTHDGEEVPYWGVEGTVSYQCHPMNPHNRVRIDGALTEDSLRDALRAGRVTVADWHENWIDLEVRAEGARAGIGERLELPVGAPVSVTVQGYGSPEVYSGAPRLELVVGRVGAAVVEVLEVGAVDVRGLEADAEATVEIELRERSTSAVTIPEGDFAVTLDLGALGPGEWLVAARVRPDSPPEDYWRGVQITNPARVHVGP